MWHTPTPEYRIDIVPQDKAIGEIIDGELKKHFLNQTIVFRGVASSEHLDKTTGKRTAVVPNHKELQKGTLRSIAR